MEKELLNTFDKELLLKDLCARLPYGVKVEAHGLLKAIADDYNNRDIINAHVLNGLNLRGYFKTYSIDCMEKVPLFDRKGVCNIKPYLFPLSSMTEEQYDSLYESGILDNCSHSYEYVNPHIHGVSFIFREFKTYSLELIEWLNKNHFDYYGLIPMGLAIDATGLNIY